MSANATDQRLHFSNKIEDTVLLTVDTTARQTSDAMGPLQPGKYLVQALSITGRCFVKAVPFVKGHAPDVVSPADPAAGASALIKEFPLDALGVRSFTFFVREGINDRLEAKCAAAGAAVLAITRTGE